MYLKGSSTALLALLLMSTSVSTAALTKVEDLVVIDDPTNPSDGLRYLDMTFSDGQSQTQALTNALAKYSNARLATAIEFDHLLTAADFNLAGNRRLSEGFLIGGSFSTTMVATGDMTPSQFIDIFGATIPAPRYLQIWTQPDGHGNSRDYISFSTGGSVLINQTGALPPNDSVGWLLVSEASPVPVPGAALLGLVGLATSRGVLRRRR